jgi:hypothetical protein
MSRGAPPSPGGGSKRKPRFPLRCFFNPQHPRGRFATNGSGVIEDKWKLVNAFEICESATKGGVIAVYNSVLHPREATQDLLLELEYTDFLASGVIDTDLQELRFERPDDLESCRDWLVNATDDTEFLRHFGCCTAFAPNGERFGEINAFCIRSNGDA